MASESSAVGGVRRPRSDDEEAGTASKRPRKSNPMTRDLDSEKKRVTTKECKKLALAGNPQAQWRLATVYYYGQAGEKVDIPQSLPLYALASEAGYPPAMYDMGCFYADGLPGLVDVDVPKAIKLWEKAAQGGTTVACAACRRGI